MGTTTVSVFVVLAVAPALEQPPPRTHGSHLPAMAPERVDRSLLTLPDTQTAKP